jgi:hypothetical protein
MNAFEKICHRTQQLRMLSMARAADGREFHSVCADMPVTAEYHSCAISVCREVRDHAAGFELMARMMCIVVCLSMARCVTMNRSAVTAVLSSPSAHRFAAGLGHDTRTRGLVRSGANIGTRCRFRHQPPDAKSCQDILVMLYHESHEEYSCEAWRVELARGSSTACSHDV